MQNITISKLQELIKERSLITGEQYRIIDYKPTYSDGDFIMLGHPFDIIIVAESIDTINENVSFDQHAGDTYFQNNKLEQWYGKINIGPRYTMTVSKKINGILYSAYLLKTKNHLLIKSKHYFEYEVSGDDLGADIVYSKDFPLKDGSKLIDINGNEFTYDFILSDKEDADFEITWLVDEFGNKAEYDFKNRFYTWCSSFRQLPPNAHYGFTFGDMRDESLVRYCGK